MKFLILVLLLVVTGCASSLAERCEQWDHEKDSYELGWGVTYKNEKYACVKFKSEQK